LSAWQRHWMWLCFSLQGGPRESRQLRAPLPTRDKDNNEADMGNIDSGRRQPDFILVFWKHKLIAVVDLTWLSDELSVQLEEAYSS
jgi:hypothetical protein